MAPQCPITRQMVDERTARVNASITFAVMVAAMTTPAHWLALLLAADLLLRGFVDPRLSPLARLVGRTLRRLSIPPTPTNAGPKMFAAKIAFVLAVLTSTLEVLGFPVAGLVAGGILVFCSGLEAFIGFCLGCWMYSYMPDRLRAIVGAPAYLGARPID